MAIQFPNFLSAPVAKSDYSGLGDIVSNYYAGRAMPKEDLIKQIQAEFARPNAEQNLQGLKLGNQSTILGNQGAGLTNEKLRLEIAKYRRDQAIEQEFQNQIAQALRGGNANAGSVPVSQPIAPPTQAPRQINPALARAVQQQFQQNTGDTNAPTAPPFTPNAPFTPTSREMPTNFTQPMNAEQQPQAQAQPSQAASRPDELVIQQGDPTLAGVDAMWDKNPLARAFLKTKGYDKVVKNERDKKTGAELVYTKYPSGKIIRTSVMPPSANDEEGGIPLTRPVLNKVVNQVRGADAVLPYIDEILRMGDFQVVKDKDGKVIDVISGEKNELPHFSYLPTNAHAGYKRTVSEALEKYMAATGVNSTDLQTKKIEEILERAGGESTNHYLYQLYKKRIAMLKDREKNVGMITKGLKKFTDFSEPTPGETYSSSEWETTNAQ